MWRGAFFGEQELLEEETHEGDDAGLLLQSLYGTRDASANFQEEVKKVVDRAGTL